MKVLVVGSGGREHAIAWALVKSPQVECVFVAPGNGGTEASPKMLNVAIDRIEDLAEFAKKESISFTVVGPEAPLAAGIVNHFRQQGLRIWGPTREAAQLESSKDFAKQFMVRHGIPTARYETFTDAEKAKQYISTQGAPIVVKADGLAAGKGVVVAMTEHEAFNAVDSMLSGNSLGSAGGRVVIEEFLEGEEASFIVLCDGKTIIPLVTSQDHKRLLDGDLGPNTGGMGAYSPAPIVTTQVHDQVMREIIKPTIDGMAAEGITFTGFLYAGLMIDHRGHAKTLEFNCRLGDPETQVILPRLKTDFVDVMSRGVDGNLDGLTLDWDSRSALGIVIANEGYPNRLRGETKISSLPADTDSCIVFHAASRKTPDGWVGTGGRVLCVTGLGVSIQQARVLAYGATRDIQITNAQWRGDIGHRAF